MVVAGALGHFFLISLSLIGSLKCYWLLLILGTVEYCDDVI